MHLSDRQQTSASVPATHDASHKFHLEINLDQKQIQAAETCVGALAAAALAVYEVKTGKFLSLASRVSPLAEDASTAVWANAMRLAKMPPKCNYFELKNGISLTLQKDVPVFTRESDMISIASPNGAEAHLLRRGSRAVIRADGSNFFDQAGVGVHVPVLRQGINHVLFENKELTPNNLKLFSKIENSFLTGNPRPLERIPNLMEQASKF